MESNSAPARPERHIFRYFNGAAYVYGDPLTIQRRLFQELDGDPNAVLNRTKSEDRVGTAYPATERLLSAVRAVFGMAAFDPATGEGATEDDCMAALWGYVDWLEEKKTSTDGKQTSPEPTESQPSAADPSTTSAA